MTWKNKWVRVEKFSPTINPTFRTPTNKEYEQNKENGRSDHMSIPNGYTLGGVCLSNPYVDLHLKVLRYERNGIQLMGNFETSRIISTTETVQDDGSVLLTISTRNSVYQITEDNTLKERYS